MKPIPIGIEDFEKIIKEDFYYVDKTKVIEDLLKKKSNVVLFTRPRRFGKSLLISTLDYFFNIENNEDNKILFNGLYIRESEYFKYQGKYPVIRLDFKDLKGDTYETIYRKLVLLISRIYKVKSYVKDIIEDEDDLNIFESIKNGECSKEILETSIKFLSELLEEFHQEKVIILIDEYDTPINEGYDNKFYEEIVNLIQPILSMSLKGNDSLKFGVLTGVLRVVKESLFSAFNNLDVYDVMSEPNGYNEYFGFTEKETKEFLNHYELTLTKEISDNYDGYNIGETHIYNPWSIINYANRKTIKPYWINTGSNKLVKELLKNLKIEEKTKLEQLCQGNEISFIYREGITYEELDSENSNFNAILNLLLFSGYITFNRREISQISGENLNFFKLPNIEVKKELINILQNISFESDITSKYEYEEFLKSIIEGNKKSIESFLNEALKSISYYDTKELFYHGYMLGIFGGFLNNNFIVKSNREGGNGRFDLMIEAVDKSVGIIIELKICEKETEIEKKVMEAQKQMKEKEYYKELELEKIKNIKEIVIVFYKKSAVVR